MMMNEFTERTGIEPTAEEYGMIEEMYYEFDGDKNAFCKDFVKKNRMLEVQREIVAAVREKVEQLRKDQIATDKELHAAQNKIARLEAELEREQEWKPWTNKDAVMDEDYNHLATVGREMTDDEAKDWIADEWGFDRSKIRICRKMKTYEVNRHSMLRQVGEIDRDPYYDATDWYYVFFRVCGMEYEAYNGSLTQL